MFDTEHVPARRTRFFMSKRQIACAAIALYTYNDILQMDTLPTVLKVLIGLLVLLSFVIAINLRLQRLAAEPETATPRP